MSNILNLFFAIIVVSDISARLFNELTLFFYNVRLFATFVHSINKLKIRELIKAPFYVSRETFYIIKIVGNVNVKGGT